MEKLDAFNVNAAEVIAALRAGHPGIMENLYDAHRAAFLGWASKRFYSTPSDIEDAWQEAVAVFYKQVVSGQLTALKCSVKTFLFAVGYKWLLKNHRKTKRIWWRGEEDEALATDPLLTAFSFDDDIWKAELLLLLAAMEALSPQCKELLVDRHYHERTIQELLDTYEYASKNAVTATLSSCLSKLKLIIKEKTKKWLQELGSNNDASSVQHTDVKNLLRQLR